MGFYFSDFFCGMFIIWYIGKLLKNYFVDSVFISFMSFLVELLGSCRYGIVPCVNGSCDFFFLICMYLFPSLILLLRLQDFCCFRMEGGYYSHS